MSLKQPPFRPPPWVFGPAWTLLYSLMGYAAYRAMSIGTSPSSSPATQEAARAGATLYTIQLGLNLIWTPLFFTLKRPVAATVDIVALLGMTGYLTYLWGFSVDAIAGYCLVPYVAWLSFATYLCAGAGYLNDWDLSDKVQLE
jgi:benzodiazapine receptor